MWVLTIRLQRSQYPPMSLLTKRISMIFSLKVLSLVAIPHKFLGSKAAVLFKFRQEIIFEIPYLCKMISRSIMHKKI